MPVFLIGYMGSGKSTIGAGLSKLMNVDFIDLDGNKKEKLFSGFEAICVQHEIDHLSGTLFTAYLSRLKRQIIVKKMQKFKKYLNKSI